MNIDTSVFIGVSDVLEFNVYPDDKTGPFAIVHVCGTATDATILFDTSEDAKVLARAVSKIAGFLSDSKPVGADELAEGGERDGDD